MTLTAVALVKRLVALVPPQGLHLTCFHGVFAPNARLRRVVMQAPPPPPAPVGTPAPVAKRSAWRLSRASGRHDGRQGGRELRGTRNSVNSRFLLTRCISYPRAWKSRLGGSQEVRVFHASGIQPGSGTNNGARPSRGSRCSSRRCPGSRPRDAPDRLTPHERSCRSRCGGLPAMFNTVRVASACPL